MSSSDSSVPQPPVIVSSGSMNADLLHVEEGRSTCPPVFNVGDYHEILLTDQADGTGAPPQQLDAQKLMSSQPYASINKRADQSANASIPPHFDSQPPTPSFNGSKGEYALCEDRQSDIFPEVRRFTKERRAVICVIGFAILGLFAAATASIIIFRVLPIVPTEPPDKYFPTKPAPTTISLPGKIAEWNGYEYIFCDLKKEWEDARQDCVHWGGDLASIHSREENDFVNNLHQGTCNKEKCPNGNCGPLEPCNRYDWRVWIGLNDNANEATYVWTDGSVNDFSAWDLSVQPMQPNNGQPNQSSENCVIQSGYDGSWYYDQCYNRYRAICKRIKP